MHEPLRERIFDWVVTIAMILGVCLLALMVLAIGSALGESWGLWELGMVA